MPCSSQIISEMLLEMRTMEKFDFLKLINHSLVILILCLLLQRMDQQRDVNEQLPTNNRLSL